MKKILLVLVALMLVSFLFVGCLPGMTPSEGEGEGEGEEEIILSVEHEYTSPSGVTYVPCSDKVTVTFPSPIATDYVVYIARKLLDGEGNVVYKTELTQPAEPVAAEPNADRTVWTVDGYKFLYDYPCGGVDRAGVNNGIIYCDCEPICLVALVKHPCCPGDEAALRVVTVDCFPPDLDLFVKFTDCYDPCAEYDECNPPFAGVSMEWTSRTSDDCTTEDCCGDDCSGIAGWSLVIDPDPCASPCDTVTGVGCPVEGILGCECLTYAETDEESHYVDFYIEDNVGNKVESTWHLLFDTDELIYIDKGFRNESGQFVSADIIWSPDLDGWWQLYNKPGCPIVP